MTKKMVLIILLVAIVPMFFLLNLNELRNLVSFSSLISTQEGSVQEYAKNRLEYYSKPRKVIKFAALGAWKMWDEHEINLKSTIQYTIDKINSQNTNKKIEIIWYDNENSAKKSDDLIDEIVAQEDIFGVIGPLQSSTVSVIKNKVSAANLLHISMTQGDIDFVVSRAKSYFSATVSVFAEAQAVSEYGNEPAFILIKEDDLYSKKYSDIILRKFHNHNLNVIGSLTYERSNTTGYVQRYINDSLNFAPDLKIIAIGNAGMYADFYKNYKDIFNSIKYEDFIINQDSISWNELKLLPNIDKSFIILNFNYDDKLIEVMQELYQKANIKTTIYANALVYRMMFILSYALENAESNDINAVLNYMNENTLVTPFGNVTFDKDGFIKDYPIKIVSAKEVYDFLKKVDIAIVE